MLKILISGSTGFIGKNLLSYLVKKKYSLMVIGRNLDCINIKKIKKKNLDLNNYNYKFKDIIDFDPDVFIHLAWEGIPDYSEELSKKNYRNTIRIVNKLVNFTNCSKIIITGSCWEYDDGNLKGECNENFVINPKKPFTIYKNKILQEISILTKHRNIVFNWLRLFYVYGPGQKKNSVIPSLIYSLKNKKKININYPANVNDYIYVDDVVKIINKFVSNNISSGVYNVGSGRGIELRKLMKIIDIKINGNDFITTHMLNKINENNKNQEFYASTKKLKKYIKNIKFLDLDKGIQNLLN